jgi:hypothetical protein
MSARFVRTLPRSRRSKKQAAPALTAAKAPWVDRRIDYGPATSAAREIASWALDLAERGAEDWPEARLRVRNARRWVLARIDGKQRHAPFADIVFTAQLLARIFDEDLGLDLADALSIFDRLDLPTDLVPVRIPRAPTPVKGKQSTRVPSSTFDDDHAVFTPPPLRFCERCSVVHEPGDHLAGYRNAA